MAEEMAPSGGTYILFDDSSCHILGFWTKEHSDVQKACLPKFGKVVFKLHSQ